MELIYGRDKTERIVSCEVLDGNVLLFIQKEDGTIEQKALPSSHYILAHEKLDGYFEKLEGNLHYNWCRKFKSLDDFNKFRAIYRKKDIYTVKNEKEAAMLTRGFTYFKGMKLKDLSVLAFDIESTGLEHNSDSKVLIIANTLRIGDKLTRKMFCYDDYKSCGEMIDAWATWVREANPSVMLGHNIYMYDLPYINYCANKDGYDLKLGRDGSELVFDSYTSKFRKDGSQFYDYTKCHVFGREIVDTFFLSIKYDTARKYPNYKLKDIIEFEKLQKKNRQFYDAAKIRDNYTVPEEWTKIKKYAKDDGDDALALFDLMCPSYFYMSQSVPMPFENIINKATGSQLNAILLRSYLQKFHSIPKADEKIEYEGAISFGKPGVYHNASKVDVASLYPSIIRQYRVFDKNKDPEENFLKVIEYFTDERLKNKQKAQETNDKYYKDLSESGKIFANSGYGLLGAKLNFNSPEKAAFITAKGREILQKSIKWAEDKNFIVVNGDTDSIMFCKDMNKPFTDEERKLLLDELNSQFDENIKFADDGYYKHVLILKSKNYILDDGKKRKIKGSALKATNKERALKDFIEEMIEALLRRKKDRVIFIYMKYAKEILNLIDITRWSNKKTITDKVLKAEQTTAKKVSAAISGSEYRMSDKIFVYFDKENNIKLQEHWKNDHNVDVLLNKLYDTLEIFSSVVDVECFPNFKLGRNEELVEWLK